MRLIQLLTDFQRLAREQSPASLTVELQQALLDFGTSSRDNLKCADNLVVGLSPSGYGRTSLGVLTKQSRVPVGHLMNVLEDLPMPPEIRNKFPDLTQTEWEACLRLQTLLSLLLTSAGSST